MHSGLTDRRILACLAENGRATQAELGQAANLSPSAAWRRARALEDSGIITGYRAELDLQQLGLGMTVMVTVSLTSQADRALDRFEEAVKNCPSVLRCHLMSGRDDYLLVLAVGSLEDYEQIHRQQIATLPSVARIETAFALREVINRPLPIDFGRPGAR